MRLSSVKSGAMQSSRHATRTFIVQRKQKAPARRTTTHSAAGTVSVMVSLTS